MYQNGGRGRKVKDHVERWSRMKEKCTEGKAAANVLTTPCYARRSSILRIRILHDVKFVDMSTRYRQSRWALAEYSAAASGSMVQNPSGKCLYIGGVLESNVGREGETRSRGIAGK